MTSDNSAQPDRNPVCKTDDIHLLLVIPSRAAPNGYALRYMSDSSLTDLMPDEVDATVTHAAQHVRERRTKAELDMAGSYYGLVSGRMSALAWVLAMDWERSSDQ
jgi:hypothetical protein